MAMQPAAEPTPLAAPVPVTGEDLPAAGHAAGSLSGERIYRMLVTAVRLLLGTDFLINGVNWWFKLIGPYPSISDYIHHPPPPDFVGAMIQTGIIFHIVKATELLSGLALLTNRFVPLMLVVVMPITVPVFVVDDLISHHLRAKVMGTGALVQNTFLILTYLSYYRSMLIARATPDSLSRYGVARTSLGGSSTDTWLFARLIRPIMPLYGTLAAIFGIAMVSWVAVMMVQYLMR